MLDLFRYAHPPKKTQRLMVLVSSIAALFWLYFSIIQQQLLQRMLEGKAQILDALIGFPLVIALAIVIYATVYWFIKWIIILLAPQTLTLPPEEDEVEFDPSDDHDNPPGDKS